MNFINFNNYSLNIHGLAGGTPVLWLSRPMFDLDILVSAD